jgi:hypothetical protein
MFFPSAPIVHLCAPRSKTRSHFSRSVRASGPWRQRACPAAWPPRAWPECLPVREPRAISAMAAAALGAASFPRPSSVAALQWKSIHHHDHKRKGHRLGPACPPPVSGALLKKIAPPCALAPTKGAVQTFISSPVELLKIRLQLQRAKPGAPGYVGPLGMLRRVLKYEGVAGTAGAPGAVEGLMRGREWQDRGPAARRAEDGAEESQGRLHGCGVSRARCAPACPVSSGR